MTIVVTHTKVSGKPAGGDPNRVYGTHWDANHTLAGTADATQLNANVVQAITNDTNIQGSIASQTLTFSWGGTLAAARLNTNVVQAITNDTNVTGTISVQNLTLGWTGQLAAGRGGFGTDVSAQSGVPLFAAGVPTFTSTTGTGNFVRAISPTITGTLTAAIANFSGVVSVASASAQALTVGLNGATNPAFAVDASTALQVAGAKIVGAVTGGTVVIQATDSGANTGIQLTPKGTGVVNIGGTVSSVINLTASSGGTTVNLGATGTSGASVVIAGGASGAVTLTPQTAASGTLSLPNGTDTLVARATTDTLTNKTISGSSNTLSSVALSSLANQAAWTFLFNNTSGSAAPTANTIDGLTVKASPAAGDELILWDVSGTAIKKATVSSLTAASGVSSIAGNTGAFTLNSSTGLTNSTNDIQLQQASSSQFGAVKVDNVTILAASGIIGQKATTATNSLGADVALNNTANYFDGPSCAQGTSGTWWVSGTVTVTDTANAFIVCKLWDGTTVIASGQTSVTANGVQSVTLSGVITSPAANLRISCKDLQTANGKILFNNTGNSKDSTITARRIQ